MQIMKKNSTSKSQSKTEIALKESEQRYRTTLMSVGDGVIATDTEGRVEMMNPVAEELTGWKEEEARGKSLEEIFCIINEDTRKTVENPVRHVMREGMVVGLANHSLLIAKDGTEHPIADSGAPIRNEKGDITGMVLVFRDQTQERIAQKALEESQEKYYYLYENSPVGMYHTKIDGSKVLEINNSACEMLGLAKEEILGKPSSMRWADPNRRNEILKILKEYGVANNFDAEILKKDGSKFSCLLSMKIFREKDYIEGFMIDISERKRAEEQIRSFSKELEQKVKDLDKAVTDLKRSNQELEQFAYVASHDLQEPLRMVSSYTQLLERRYKDKLDQDAKDFINYAVDGANRMQRLINDLLEFSRVTTKGKPLVKIDLSTVLGQAVANLHNKIQETGSMIVNDDLPFAFGDEGQLVRVFQNLLDNAMKFKGEGSPRINVTSKILDDKVQISISDNGIGIDKIYSDRVFTIFQRLHTKADYPGTGIGLAICKRTIERHGGTIWFESEPGKGSTFCFTLNIK